MLRRELLCQDRISWQAADGPGDGLVLLAVERRDQQAAALDVERRVDLADQPLGPRVRRCVAAGALHQRAQHAARVVRFAKEDAVDRDDQPLSDPHDDEERDDRTGEPQQPSRFEERRDRLVAHAVDLGADEDERQHDQRAHGEPRQAVLRGLPQHGPDVEDLPDRDRVGGRRRHREDEGEIQRDQHVRAELSVDLLRERRKPGRHDGQQHGEDPHQRDADTEEPHAPPLV